jgi:uncharacterized glyoxalase superfamily protein PhnB
MFSKITTNLMVGDGNEALAFYEGIPGFRLVMGVPEGSQQIVTTRDDHTPLGFAIVKRDEVELMLQSQQSLAAELPEFRRRSVGGAITLYIQVANARELYEQVKDRVTICKDLHTTFYGAEEFYIRDGNGYVLTFASR